MPNSFLTPPPVTNTEEMVLANVASEHYFTATDGVIGAGEADHADAIPATLDLLTFCVLVLQNGFKVTGVSVCVDPSIFDKQKGREMARKDALSRVWEFMGYQLATDRTRYAAQNKPKTCVVDGSVRSLEPHQHRVILERDDLLARLSRLQPFLLSKVFKDVNPDEQHRLICQEKTMRELVGILEARIAAF